MKIIGLLLAVAGALAAAELRREDLALALWRAQDTDGAWRSRTYRLLADGPSLTGLVALALARSGVPAPAEGRARVLGFLRNWVDNGRSRGQGYPTYAAAHALAVFAAWGGKSDQPRIDDLRTALILSQHRSETGQSERDPAHGGWGFADPGRGHVDLSHTRTVLEALASSGGVPAASGRRAERFLALCRKDPRDPRPQPVLGGTTPAPAGTAPCDGGFYYSPVIGPANKGGGGTPEQPWFGSYASATADGLLALRALGCGDDHPAVAAATAWLDRHPGWRRPAGVSDQPGQPWSRALVFYHAAVRARAMPPDDGGPVVAALEPYLAHGSEGLVVNPEGFLNKEDDPLVASALALEALAAASPRPP